MNILAKSVRLTGFLGAAPEIKLTDNQRKYVRISLATRCVTRNAKNEWFEQTDWDKQAEIRSFCPRDI